MNQSTDEKRGLPHNDIFFLLLIASSIVSSNPFPHFLIKLLFYRLRSLFGHSSPVHGSPHLLPPYNDDWPYRSFSRHSGWAVDCQNVVSRRRCQSRKRPSSKSHHEMTSILPRSWRGVKIAFFCVRRLRLALFSLSRAAIGDESVDEAWRNFSSYFHGWSRGLCNRNCLSPFSALWPLTPIYSHSISSL